MANLVRSKVIAEAARRLWADPAVLATRCMEVQQIAAPTGNEAARSQWVFDTFRELGYKDVERDDLHNVVMRIAGEHEGMGVLLSGHLDTVFEASTDLRLRNEPRGQRIYGPGIGDNSTGVAALILMAEAMLALPKPPVDVWLAANSGEEGLGDLRGMRRVVDNLHDKIGACVVIEGMGLGRIVHRALGSQRFRIQVDAPGGHSWSDFGTASAIHVLVQIARELTELQVPISPRSTYNIGRISGGRSVNTIAQTAQLELDLRSEDGPALAKLVQNVAEIIAQYQGPDWLRRHVSVSLAEIGNRPAGEIPIDHPLVAKAAGALREAGYQKTPDFRISSTDANIPLSRGIPAICIGITEGGNAHRLEEWIHVAPLKLGMRQLLLLTWAVAEWLAEDTMAATA